MDHNRSFSRAVLIGIFQIESFGQSHIQLDRTALPCASERIENGLRIMIKDGSFDAIFYKHNKAAIERANLKNRRIIRLDNHLLPKATPLDEKNLWFDPTRD